MQTSCSSMLAGIMAVLLTGCYYDHEAILYPDKFNCKTDTNSSYQTDIAPIMTNHCVSCHNAGLASGAVRLDNYGEVTKYVADGSLVGSITHASGFSPMPKNAAKLSSCEIERIQTWVSSGALNN